MPGPSAGHGVAGPTSLSKGFVWVILSLTPPPLRSAGPPPSLPDPLCAAGDWPRGPHGLGPLVLVTSVWLQLCAAWAAGREGGLVAPTPDAAPFGALPPAWLSPAPVTLRVEGEESSLP